jgi:hypothetical protein
VDLVVPLDRTRAVTEFVDAVRRAPDPSPIAAGHKRAIGKGPAQRWVVNGVRDAVRRSAAELTMFSEQDVPWSAPTGGETAVALHVGAVEVANYQVAPAVERELSPRPFLHPVRTLGGTVVTDRQPDDHRWHLGFGVAIQDVDGTNFWGGRTYVAGRGYEWRDDHGAVRHLSWHVREHDRLVHDLAWMTPEQRCLLIERRSIAVRPALDGNGRAATDRWILEVGFDLRNVSGRRLELGSPGSHGREGGGYGGFFWRLPPLRGRVDVRTEKATGERDVHGEVAPWLAWSHDDSGHSADDDAGLDPRRDRHGGSFTLVAGADAADPWFVRVEQYPGFGSALAWDRPVVIAPGESIRRAVSVNIADGADHDPAALYDELDRPREADDAGE